MEQFGFLKWKVYSDAQSLFSEVLRISKTIPKEYRFSFGDQMVRASLSVILNIAEGSGKHSDKELARFLDISLGSLYETAACIDTLTRNDLLGSREKEVLLKKVENICKQLGGFRKN